MALTTVPSPDLPEAAPNSAGNSLPRLMAPADACDTHLHIVDGRFPLLGPAGTRYQRMAAADYRLLQRRLGLTRAVLVQHKAFGTDNSCLLDAMLQLGASVTRGIAVAHPEVSDQELRRLDAAGVRGLRFSLWNPLDAVTTIEMVVPLARRIHELGWHVQLHMSGEQIAAHAGQFKAIPCPIVFDHMGRPDPLRGTSDPAFAVILQLLDRGRAWVKLSGAYLNTASNSRDYADASAVARAYVQAAPQFMLWGSDWPHVTESEKPDDAVLFDLLSDWAPGATLADVLVHNPARLYRF